MVLKRFSITMINIFCTQHRPFSIPSPIPLLLSISRRRVARTLTSSCKCLTVPPIAVMLLAGPETDMIINCLLFLCAVIPAHIHGFYISIVYFSRKRKVRKGIYPGGHRPFIYSKRVLNGGASSSQAESLRQQQQLGGEKMDGTGAYGREDVNAYDRMSSSSSSRSRKRCPRQYNRP